MGRRPYIEVDHIRDYLRPGGARSDRPGGYTAGAKNTEVIGMDGRNDWFRCECRECGRKIITRRNEKSQRYFACPDCGAWHHVYRGFFTLPDRKNGFETQPLRPSEVDGPLFHAVGTQDAEFYGSKQYIIDTAENHLFDISHTYHVTDTHERVVTLGEVSA